MAWTEGHWAWTEGCWAFHSRDPTPSMQGSAPQKVLHSSNEIFWPNFDHKLFPFCLTTLLLVYYPKRMTTLLITWITGSEQTTLASPRKRTPCFPLHHDYVHASVRSINHCVVCTSSSWKARSSVSLSLWPCDCPWLCTGLLLPHGCRCDTEVYLPSQMARCRLFGQQRQSAPAACLGICRLHRPTIVENKQNSSLAFEH